MKTIRILLLALLASAAFVCPRAQAQIGQITNPVSAPLYVQDAGTCSATANSNLIQQLPPNASTTTVNLSGTFSATVTVRASNNGGVTWVTLGTASAAGTTAYGTNSYTHLCADVTTYTSGTVNVTISTGVVGGGNGNSGSVSLPTTLSAPGVFTNTQMNENYVIQIGSGCSPTSIFAGWNASNFLTDGLTGVICVPSNSANDWSQAVAAYTQSQGAHSVVGFGSVGEGSATGAKVWGANLNLFSDPGMNSQLFGLESDISPVNTGDTAAGIFLQDASSVQPTGSFRAIEVDALTATSGWNIGLLFDNGAIASNGVTFQAISIGTQRASGNPDNSQTISFHARNSGGTTLNCSMELLGSSVGDTADGVFGFGQCPLQVTEITSVGTQSISGCSLTSALGGPWSGSFHSGTAGTCTVTITMKQASNGFACKAQDMTTVADIINQTAFTTTTATLSGTTASGDVITWSCLAF